jgi:hypothetical protein
MGIIRVFLIALFGGIGIIYEKHCHDARYMIDVQ